MANSLNKVMLIGHLGDEVKMHYFEGGNCIGRFPVATNETYSNRQTGEKVTTTEWHNVVVRNKLAELCEKFLSKGDRVYVEGKIKTRQWEQEGVKRYTTEIHAVDMTFLTTKKDLSNPAAASPHESQTDTTPGISAVNDTADDLPF
ncbi:single-stranded DNA-binding protein [Lutimonas zeaxanthinifaciens]|uniref:single-stranded DNA-binding protein n=1 Tax=Lutimonas zeaxanthinifaciens TaxID=3060215 RepID=UPI00265D5838|nr:single-stranded DNA-binding protein [Lutimonas sp. YSD2104]WKK66553.1 single-stranded DNA-binding protein [Lutimonas sp. YSD2104]